MFIVYRMCDVESTNPAPWNAKRREVNRRCLNSFIKAFEDVNPFVYFLCDNCPKNEYVEMINSVPFNKNLEFTEIGINNTMLKAYELASQANDVVLLQECDYLYRPKTGFLLNQAILSLGLVSPYDNLNFYIDKSIHSDNADLRLVENHHFRTTERNTMTWGCHSDLINENIDVLNKYGYLDNEVWRELYWAGHSLHVPIPSIATHMVNDYMAPGINWLQIWEENA